jgi:hypothetical protein
MQDEAQRQGEADNAVADDAASGTEMSQ